MKYCEKDRRAHEHAESHFTLQQLGGQGADGRYGQGRECSSMITVATLPRRSIATLNQTNKHQEEWLHRLLAGWMMLSVVTVMEAGGAVHNF